MQPFIYRSLTIVCLLTSVAFSDAGESLFTSGPFTYRTGASSYPPARTPGTYLEKNAPDYCGSDGRPISAGGSGVYQIPCTKTFVTKYDSQGSEVFTAWLSYGISPVYANAATADSDGNIYVAGGSPDPRIPSSAASGQNGDGFVIKLSRDGSTLLWAIRFSAIPNAIAVNSKGEVWVGGETNPFASEPTQVKALQTRKNNETNCRNEMYPLTCSTGFVAKVNSQGTGFEFASYLGGSYRDSVTGIAIDAADDVYLTGIRSSSDFPLTETSGVASRGGIFLIKLHGDLPEVRYALSFGGRGTFDSPNAGTETPSGIAVDSTNSLVIAGATIFSDFGIAGRVRSTKASVCGTAIGGTNTDCPFVFVLRLDSSTGLRTALTSFESSSGSSVAQLALDSTGVAYITGSTNATNFPVTENANQVCNAGSYFNSYAAAFLAEIAPDGSIRYATYGGSAADSGSTLLLNQQDGSIQPLLSVNVMKIRTGSRVPPNRALAVQCVVNAGSQRTAASIGAFSSVSPGEHVTLFGQFSTSGTESIQVFFDNYQAPLLSATNTRIEVIVPKEIASLQSCALSVKTVGSFGTRTASVWNLKVADSLPGIFTVNESGSGQAVALNEDGTANSVANPARRGSLIQLFATGFPVDNTVPDGRVAPTDGPDVKDKQSVQLVLDPFPLSPFDLSGTIVSPSYVGQAANYVQGTDRIELQIPGSPGSLTLLRVQLNGYLGMGAPPYIAVQ